MSSRKKKLNKELYEALREQKKQQQYERDSYLAAITENLSVPAALVKNNPVLTFYGRNSLLIENHKKILEYTDQCIRIQAKQYMIKLTGIDLKIIYCTREELKITGFIKNLTYQ